MRKVSFELEKRVSSKKSEFQLSFLLQIDARLRVWMGGSGIHYSLKI